MSVTQDGSHEKTANESLSSEAWEPSPSRDVFQALKLKDYFRVCKEIPRPIPHPVVDTVQFIILGQGTIALEVKKFADPKPYSIVFQFQNPNEGKIEIEDKQIKIILGTQIESFEVAERLLSFPEDTMFLWVSVDKENHVIRIGHGYMMKRNQLCEMKVKDTSPTSLVNLIVGIKYHQAQVGVKSIKVERMPIVSDAPPVVLDRNTITLEDIAKNRAISSSMLLAEAQYLFGIVSGRSITLAVDDAAAINYSLLTPGKTLYQKRKDKEEEFGDPKMVYIRVTIGADEGNSPGSPFVLEIWPPGCRSPIHNHSWTVAIIKVLHGTIRSTWFNPPSQNNNPAKPKEILNQTFEKGDVTWISPEMYQTHQLENPREDTMCATIQSYRYLESDNKHYEFFDWIDKNGELNLFKPNSDYDFLKLLEIVRREYQEGNAMGEQE